MTPGQAERFGEKGHERVVRRAIHRRSGETHGQGFAANSCNACPSCPRNDPDGQGYPACTLAQANRQRVTLVRQRREAPARTPAIVESPQVPPSAVDGGAPSPLVPYPARG
jgi:hypothetical protein